MPKTYGSSSSGAGLRMACLSISPSPGVYWCPLIESLAEYMGSYSFENKGKRLMQNNKW